MNPGSGTQVIPNLSVSVLSTRETYAEKVRAALTRRDPAIRDFFDIDSAIMRAILRPTEEDVLGLISRKLAVIDDAPIDLSPAKIAILQGQIETQLKPVLRAADYEQFELSRAVRVLKEVVSKCRRQ